MNIMQVPRAYKLWWQLNYAADMFALAMFYITKDGEFDGAGQCLRACGLAAPSELPDPQFCGSEEQPGLFRRTG